MTKAVLPYFRERMAGTHHPGNLDRRTHRTSRARTVRSREVQGVEGFSESLFKEIGPLGIKVTSLNLAAFAQMLPGPPPNVAKPPTSMTPPSVRLFASKKL